MACTVGAAKHPTPSKQSPPICIGGTSVAQPIDTCRHAQITFLTVEPTCTWGLTFRVAPFVTWDYLLTVPRAKAVLRIFTHVAPSNAPTAFTRDSPRPAACPVQLAGFRLHRRRFLHRLQSFSSDASLLRVSFWRLWDYNVRSRSSVLSLTSPAVQVDALCIVFPVFPAVPNAPLDCGPRSVRPRLQVLREELPSTKPTVSLEPFESTSPRRAWQCGLVAQDVKVHATMRYYESDLPCRIRACDTRDRCLLTALLPPGLLSLGFRLHSWDLPSPDISAVWTADARPLTYKWIAAPTQKK